MKTATKAKHTPHTRRIEKALIRAAATARKTAKRYGLPVYIMENGKVVAKKV